MGGVQEYWWQWRGEVSDVSTAKQGMGSRVGMHAHRTAQLLTYGSTYNRDIHMQNTLGTSRPLSFRHLVCFLELSRAS